MEVPKAVCRQSHDDGASLHNADDHAVDELNLDKTVEMHRIVKANKYLNNNEPRRDEGNITVV